MDEADYASILSQVKGAEFDAEVSRRLAELHRQQQAEEQARAAKAEQAWQKVEEEKDELIEALQNPDDSTHIEEEYGDLLFALAAYGNYIGVNPDDALEKTNKKFRERFAYIEQKAREQGKGVQHLTLDEMIAYWKEAKSPHTEPAEL